MTPKEKAKELYIKCYPIWYNNGLVAKGKYAKEYAQIVVDEILKLGLHEVGDYKDAQTSTDDFSSATWYISYWLEVKEEINKL